MLPRQVAVLALALLPACHPSPPVKPSASAEASAANVVVCDANQTIAEASTFSPGCPPSLKATPLGTAICAAPFVNDRVDTFKPVAADERKRFREAMLALLHDPAMAPSALGTLGFKTTTVSEGDTTYTLVSDGSCTRGAGVFVLRRPFRWNLVIEAPHVGFEHDTLAEGLRVLRAGGRAFFISGAHRCSAKAATACRKGKSPLPCGEGPQEYRRSDAAADIENFFQGAHEASLALQPAPLVLSLHGKRPKDGDPIVITSDGTRAEAGEASLSRRLAGRLTTAGFSAGSCQDAGSTLRLCGTVSVQGRVSNGADDACGDGATKASGLFLHLEQDFDKIETIAPELERALGELLPAVTAM